jgi:Transposase zinc-ribbon domain
MAQHFLLTSAAQTLSLASVARMSEEEAERVFVNLRWADNAGNAYCPHCGFTIVYSCRRPNGAPRWRCKACRKDFWVTSGTLFAFHKVPLRSYLLAIAIFCNEVKGRVITAKGFDATDGMLRAAIRDQVGSIIKRLHREGAIEKIGAGRASAWKLAASRLAMQILRLTDAFYALSVYA